MGQEVRPMEVDGRALAGAAGGRAGPAETDSQCGAFWCCRAECFCPQGLPFASGTGQTWANLQLAEEQRSTAYRTQMSLPAHLRGPTRSGRSSELCLSKSIFKSFPFRKWEREKFGEVSISKMFISSFKINNHIPIQELSFIKGKGK